MNTEAIVSWLRSYSGLEADSLGPGVVARIATERAVALGGGADDYLERLINSAEERRQLIDRVIVPETWFFRDRAAFDAVAKYAAETWAPLNPGKTFRVLCVPCSTGEESYSLAMAFAQIGWPSSKLSIEAVDISSENIASAQRGIYRRNSFRGADLSYRDVYLEPHGEEAWRVSDSVRQSVKFSEANLLSDDFVVGRGGYHAVFCRNLLIYFDRETQKRAISMLDSLLDQGGRFAVGPAEPVLLFSHGYTALKTPAAFLLQRAPARTAPIPVARPKIFARPPIKPKPVLQPRARPLVPKPTPLVTPGGDDFEVIQSLADAGKLDEASQRGRALLARDSTPELLCLMGVIADALGEETRAQEFYRKALYLDPRHKDSLEQIALHMEKSGDLGAARIWRSRAQRAGEREAV